MTPGDTARVLGKIAAFDLRTLGEADVLAWHEIIGHLDVASCFLAVTAHYRENSTRAMPADIRKLATDIRVRARAGEERRQRALEAAPDTASRSGAALIRHILGRLKDAGQDPASGQRLGRDRAGVVAEAAAAEWLDRNPAGVRNDAVVTSCPTCYAPMTGSCTRCDRKD